MRDRMHNPTIKPIYAKQKLLTTMLKANLLAYAIALETVIRILELITFL
jgi:hypothetical protein